MTGRELLDEILKELPELEEDKNIAISLSGGLDSTTLLYILVHKYGKNRVKALSFNFGQRHNIELEMAKKTSSELSIEHNTYNLDYLGQIAKETSALIDGSELTPKTAEENAGDPQINTYVPFRNLQFAAITASYAEAKNCQYIAQGLNQTDLYGYWDTSEEFVKRINSVLELNRKTQIQFISPFIESYKDEELLIAKELSKIFGYNILENTWSCYNGYSKEHNFKECGVCNTCAEKLKGYIQAGFSNKEITSKFNVDDEYIRNINRNI